MYGLLTKQLETKALAAIIAVSLLILAAPHGRAAECVTINSELNALLDAYAARTDTTFILDPRVRASVKLIGAEIDKLTAKDVDRILILHGFEAYESDGIVYVMPNGLPDFVKGEFGERWQQ
ncbi:MAG: hypothetical protein AAFX44_18090 [Pseudomonadota bacterium]